MTAKPRFQHQPRTVLRQAAPDLSTDDGDRSAFAVNAARQDALEIQIARLKARRNRSKEWRPELLVQAFIRGMTIEGLKDFYGVPQETIEATFRKEMLRVRRRLGTSTAPASSRR